MSDDPNPPVSLEELFAPIDPDTPEPSVASMLIEAEQAGFERGVQAERDRWLTNGTSWIKAGRAERDAEVAAHLKSEIAKWDQILNDDRRRGYLDDGI